MSTTTIFGNDPLPPEEIEPPPPAQLASTSGWHAYNETVLKHASIARHWPIDEQAGKWRDAVGTIDLTVNSDPARNQDHPYFGERAVIFDGADDYGSAATAVAVGASISYAIWLKIPTNGVGVPFMSQVDSNNALKILQWSSDNRLYIMAKVAGVNEGLRSTANGFRDGLWHFFVYTLAGGVEAIYVDGSLASWTTANLGAATGGITTIGADTAGANFFNGEIGPVSFWTAQLSAAEVLDLWNASQFQEVGGTSSGMVTARQKGAVVIGDSLYRPRYKHLSNSAQLSLDEEILADSPKWYYRLNDLEGASVLVDYSGGSFEMAVAGSPRLNVPSVRGGQLVRSLLFDGVDDIGTSVDAAAMPLDYPFTLELVVKAPAASDELLCITDSATDDEWLRIQVNSSGGTVGISAKSTTEQVHYSTTAITTGGWHHVVAVFESPTLRRIHVNGIEEGTRNVTSVAFPAGMDTISVGGYGGATPAFAAANISHAAGYQKSLTSTRILHHAAAALHHGDVALQGAATLAASPSEHGGKAIKCNGLDADHGKMIRSIFNDIAVFSPKAYTAGVAAKLTDISLQQYLLTNFNGTNGAALNVS